MCSEFEDGVALPAPAAMSSGPAVLWIHGNSREMPLRGSVNGVTSEARRRRWDVPGRRFVANRMAFIC